MNTENNKQHEVTSNRIIFAVLVGFISIPLMLLAADKLNIKISLLGPILTICILVLPAIIIDRMYMHYQNKKHITRRSNGTNNP